jgi:glycosyltransferase involved in cell wall biosynthesis
MRRRRGSPSVEHATGGVEFGHVLIIVENVSLARDHRLRKQIAALRSADYRVSVICRRDPDNRVDDGVRLYEYRAPADARSKVGFLWEYGYSWMMAALLTARIFVRDRFTALQISGTPDIYFAIGLPLRRRVALVLDQRDLSPELYELRYARRDIVYQMLCWFERRSYRSADHVITVNNSLRDTVCLRGGLDPNAVTVVGNGPVLASVEGRLAKPELKQGKPYLCCWVGLMGPQDGLDLAVRAIAEFRRSTGRTDCSFVFIGDGEYRQTCLALAADLEVADIVSFPGWMNEDELFGYLATADLGLEPNLEQTVSPVKGMEYMAFGVPFVAFDTKETRFLAGEAAAYAEPGDVQGFATLIGDLLRDHERRTEMGCTGRNLVRERLSWDLQQLAYLDVYASLSSRARLQATATDEQGLSEVAR